MNSVADLTEGGRCAVASASSWIALTAAWTAIST
jgi:hypothetical protein